MLVGKIYQPVKLQQTANGHSLAYMYLETERPFKSTDTNKRDHDFFRIKLWKGLADECAAVCKVGDLVSVKGRLQSSEFKKENGDTQFYTDIVAETLCYMNQL